MLMDIPNELLPYVRMSKKQGLVCSDDMPSELIPLFEKTKKVIDGQASDRKKQLQALKPNG
jgi:hypothetical protein